MRTILLYLLSLILIAPTGLGSVGGNLTLELEPQIVGQVDETDMVVTPDEEILWMQLRTLWLDHAFWTRMAISSLITGSEDRDPILNQLLRNNRDMANTVSPFFGAKAANQYEALFKDHLTIAVEVINATKKKDQIALQNARQKWFENADEIATFENTTVSGLPLVERRAMWYEYLNLTANETSEMSNGDYNTSIETMNRLEERATMMADALADAIILINPERFHSI